MKIMTSRFVGMILAFVMSFCCIGVVPVLADDITAGGWFETIYAQWPDSDAKSAVVEYKASDESAYIAADRELVRNIDANTARVDIPGIKAGSYDIKITAGNGTVYVKNNIEVKPYDRAGFAHKGYDRGVGAYKNDGTPKDNAIIVYVTDENKNTVTIPGYEDIGVDKKAGIGWILNNNGDNLIKISKAGHPLIIRFIGKVNPPEGLTGHGSTENGGNIKDNGFMAIIKQLKDVTIEGIGTDAVIDGWGFSFFVGAGYEYKESYEVRNLKFQNYPEDALGFQGEQSSKSADKAVLNAPIERVWVHNNSFMPGFCANPTESDKGEGDGSCDFKRGQYYTMSYNYYYNCHKTNLVGASDANHQYHMTFHHNYYEDCMSRGPLARRADIHIYNSYFKGNTSKTVDARANAYIFSEANYYDTCKNPVTAASGAVVKSFGDIFYNCDGNAHETRVDSKDTVVENNCEYKGDKYGSFENKADFYDYTITSASQAKADCIAYSGVIKQPADIVENPPAASVIENEPQNPVSLPYSVNFTDVSAEDYFGAKVAAKGLKQLDATTTPVDIDNIIYKTASKYGTASTAFKYKEQAVSFKVDKKCVVLIKSSGGSYPAVLYSSDGDVLASAKNSSAYAVVPAGTYMIQSGLAEKEAYLTSLSIKEFTSDDDIPATETESEPTSSSEPATGDPDDGDDETLPPIFDDSKGYVLDFTEGTNTDNFFSVQGKYTTNYSLEYGGATLNKMLKMESATSVSFTLSKPAKLYMITYSDYANDAKTKLDGTSVTVSKQGQNEFDLNAGSHTITKDTTRTYIAYIKIVYEGDESQDPIPGDVDGSGDVTPKDAGMVLEYVRDKKNNPLTAEQLEAANVSGENIITAKDAALILKKALDDNFEF